MKRLETESNSDISACKITEQTFWWLMKGRNLAEREKNETISHNGCNGNYKINDETNIIRLRSYTPVKQRNWSILVWFVFSVRFSMLFYSSYHSHCWRRWELSSWTPHNIQRTNLVSEMSRWWCLSLFSHLRLSTVEGGLSIFKKNTVEAFSVNIILFSFPMVINNWMLTSNCLTESKTLLQYEKEYNSCSCSLYRSENKNKRKTTSISLFFFCHEIQLDIDWDLILPIYFWRVSNIYLKIAHE